MSKSLKIRVGSSREYSQEITARTHVFEDGIVGMTLDMPISISIYLMPESAHELAEALKTDAAEGTRIEAEQVDAKTIDEAHERDKVAPATAELGFGSAPVMSYEEQRDTHEAEISVDDHIDNMARIAEQERPNDDGEVEEPSPYAGTARDE